MSLLQTLQAEPLFWPCNTIILYDCLYLALPERDSFTLVTDDAKLVTLAKRAKLADLVQAL